MGKDEFETMISNAQTIKNYLAKQFHLPEEQIEQMLPTLLNTLKSHMSKLQDALASSSPLQIGKMGHTIKGAFLNLGLKECAEIAHNIEVRGKQGDDQADYQKMFDELCIYVGPILRDL